MFTNATGWRFYVVKTTVDSSNSETKKLKNFRKWRNQQVTKSLVYERLYIKKNFFKTSNTSYLAALCAIYHSLPNFLTI